MMTRRTAVKLIALGSTAALTRPKFLLAQESPGGWAGQWIWIEGEPHPFNFFLMARRSIDFSSAPESVKLDITASDRYMLYVNGEYLGRGPARSDPLWKSYDTYEVGPRLRAGRNTVAVLAYHYGCANNYSRSERAGLYARLGITQVSGARQVISTGGSWRVRRAEGWSRDVGLINEDVGVTEVYDASGDPVDWTAPGFDDSNWKKAYVIAEGPWDYLEARQTPMMEEVEIFPTCVVQSGEVRELPTGTMTDFNAVFSANQVPERLEAEPHFPLQYAKILNPDLVLAADGRSALLQISGLHAGDSAEKGVRSPYLIVDFGRAVFGFPRIRLEGPAKAVVEMTYGPILVGNRVPAMGNWVRYGDRYIARQGKQTWQIHEYKQFRYLQLVVRNAETPLSLDSISLVSYNYPAERKGGFECSDATLTKLWKACVDTTYLQMEDTLVCDAVRERVCWSGDGGHGLYGIFAGYGDIALSERYFRLLARGQLADGELRMHYPGTEGEAGEQEPLFPAVVTDDPINIPQCSLFYAMFLSEYHQYFGKTQFIGEIYPALVRLFHWCRRHANAAGLLENLPGINFVDWVGTDMQGANLETNALYYKFLAGMRVYAEESGKLREVSKWKNEAERVKAAIRKLYWDPRREVYVDSVLEGKQSAVVTEVSNGMALSWEIATPDQAPKIVSHLADPQTHIVRASPLYFYYALEGLVKAGAMSIALKQMRDRYSPMLQASDAPTIWEGWGGVSASFGAVAPSALYGSLVHDGGVGPAWTLSKHILGVYPVGPGFEKCRVEPATEGLEWARGVFPSVRGNVRVDWKKEGERLSYDTELPAGLETILTLPRNPSENLVVSHNGKQYEVRADAKAVKGLVLETDKIGIKVLGGNHHLELSPM